VKDRVWQTPKDQIVNCIVHKTSPTPEGAAMLINSLLGKRIISPRDDIPGEVEIFDVLSIQVFSTGTESWNAVAVVTIGVRQENIDVEEDFFKDAAQKIK